MKSKLSVTVLAAACAAMVAPQVHAGLTTSRAAFELAVQGEIVDGFESFLDDDIPVSSPVSLLGGTASLTDGGSGNVIRGTPLVAAAPGRFATESLVGAPGTTWWDSGQDFTITFVNVVEAFGIDWTDLGDFSSATNCGQGEECSATGGLTVSFYDDQNNLIATHTDQTGRSNGASGFIGFFADGAKIKRVFFDNLATGVDGVGFDRATVGAIPDVPNPTPEPSTLLLSAASVFLLLRARRSVWGVK